MKFGALLVSVALICIILQVKAACICNEKGTDYCEGCNSRRIVRPKHKNYDSSTDLDLPPIGDTCWCSKVKVEPASLPKPCQKVRDPFDWLASLNNLFKRKFLEAAINTKCIGLDRMHKRLNLLERMSDAMPPIN